MFTPPPDVSPPDEALRALLHSDVLYSQGDGSRSDLAPYDQSRLSVSGGGHSAVPLSTLLSPEDANLIGGERHGLLLSQSELMSLGGSSSSRVRPYMCPVLQQREQYINFIRTLVLAGMLRAGGSKKALVTPFFVWKKNGSIRLVLDARQANQFFCRPSKVELGSGASLGQIEAPAGGLLYFASSDLTDTFYGMGIPP